MPLVINTNTLSLNAQTHLTNNTNMLKKSMEQLASGYRINRAGDDAAGLQVSENLRAQFRGAKKALDNVQDGINMLNIADGALQVISDNLQRMRELAVQAANDTYSAAQRTAIQQEIDARIADINRIATTTNYANPTDPLLDGTYNGGAAVNIQVGPNTTAGDAIDIQNALDNYQFSGGGGPLGGGGATNVSTHANAETAINTIDTAITNLNTRRGSLGAIVNQLESAQANLFQSVENLQAAESRIRNVDVAAESANMIKYQVLQQSSALMLAQANNTPTIALSLLQG